MVNVRIVLALPESHARWALSQLAPHRELRLVGQARHVVELYAVLRAELERCPQSPDDPLVVITTPGWGGGAISCTRLITEFTELIAYDIEPDGIKRYHMNVDIRQLPQTHDIFSELCALAINEHLQVVPRGSEELDRQVDRN